MLKSDEATATRCRADCLMCSKWTVRLPMMRSLWLYIGPVAMTSFSQESKVLRPPGTRDGMFKPTLRFTEVM